MATRFECREYYGLLLAMMQQIGEYRENWWHLHWMEEGSWFYSAHPHAKSRGEYERRQQDALRSAHAYYQRADARFMEYRNASMQIDVKKLAQLLTESGGAGGSGHLGKNALKWFKGKLENLSQGKFEKVFKDEGIRILSPLELRQEFFGDKKQRLKDPIGDWSRCILPEPERIPEPKPKPEPEPEPELEPVQFVFLFDEQGGVKIGTEPLSGPSGPDPKPKKRRSRKKRGYY